MLRASKLVQLQDEVTDIPADLLQAAERLCGTQAPHRGDNMARLYDLLACNSIIRHLTRSQDHAKLLDEALSALRIIGGRQDCDRDDLIAELLAYLTLGALAQQDDEPLLRPKIHYFVQGYQGMWVSFEPEGTGLAPKVYFSETATGDEPGDGIRLPLLLCRGCGQHYFRIMARESVAANSDSGDGYYPVRVLPERDEGDSDENVWYLTDSLHTEDEEIENPQDAFTSAATAAACMIGNRSSASMRSVVGTAPSCGCGASSGNRRPALLVEHRTGQWPRLSRAPAARWSRM